MPATAFLGVCARDHGVLYYELFKNSVNTEKYLSFLTNLRKKLKDQKFCIY